MTAKLAAIERQLIRCRACPELVEYRERIGREKKRAYLDHDYWAKPVPAFGDPKARLVLVGLAPGAHGSNRTGRMFTGDASGEWLYRALYRAGFASQPVQVDRNDGMVLHDCLITSAVKCAPPGNKPTTEQKARCFSWLSQEFATLRDVRAVVTLGRIGDDAFHAYVKQAGGYLDKRAAFAHGAQTRITLPGSAHVTVVASYHPSRQNTNTGVLTEGMLQDIFTRARELVDADAVPDR